jgi:glycosyltransferase involved in cell wall biosynthesis
VPTVSIVVPLYNKARWFRRALDSISRQTFEDFEAIVVDDGSTDGSAAIARAHSDGRFRVISQTNQGPGAARNRGVAESSAEFVAFLDADDEWMPEYLAHALSLFADAQPAASAATTGYVEGIDSLSSEQMWRDRGLRNGLQTVNAHTAPPMFVHMLAFMSPCTTVARRSTLQRWGGFYESDHCSYGEDAFLWLKVLLNEPVVFDLAPLVRIHRDASGLSRNLSKARPLEPFLQHSQLIENVCPAELRPLLNAFLAIRAFKTACAWGVWGRWRDAADLRRRFRSPGDLRLPYYWSSLLCATPAAGLAGRILRGTPIFRSRL